MGESKTKLSIIIATVDQATAKIKAINDRLDKITKPTRDLKKALSDFGEKSGLNNVAEGFKGVGSAVEGLLTKLAVIGGVAGLAVHALIGIVDQYDDLGHKAEKLGVGVDFLASMRDAAARTGVPLDSLDEGLTAFNQNLGQARANTGRMAKFLGIVSPELLKQVKAAKSNADAFDLMAGAMAKIQDPAKRAALAQKVFGDSSLAPLLAKGADGVKELRQHYLELAGSQQGAVDASMKTGEAMHDLHAATDGVKAALVVGLAPALTEVTEKLTKWLTGHRAEIAEWAKNIGEKLPGAIQSVVEWLGKAYDKVESFVDSIGGLKGAAVAAGLVIAGPLLASIVSLGASIISVIGNVARLKGGLSALPKVTGGPGGSGFLGAIAPPVAAALAINSATGGSLLDVARSKGVDADNIIDLFNAANNGAFERRSENGGGGFSAMQAGVRAKLNAIGADAKVTVDFKNSPAGMKAKADPQSTADVDLNVGYQMLPGLM